MSDVTPPADDASTEAATEPSFQVGDRIQIQTLPPYVKTADPMPMLRPPDTIAVGERGVIIDQRPGGFWGVRLTQGTFLLDSQYLAPVLEEVDDTSAELADDGAESAEPAEADLADRPAGEANGDVT